jgi:hypothetical protein
VESANAGTFCHDTITLSWGFSVHRTTAPAALGLRSVNSTDMRFLEKWEVSAAPHETSPSPNVMYPLLPTNSSW